MFTVFFFLLLALIIYYLVNPISKSKIWLFAVLGPMIGIIIYTIFETATSNHPFYLSNAYIAGTKLSATLIPAAISSLVIYFLLKKKIETHKTKFPTVLVVFIVLAFGGSIIQNILSKDLATSTNKQSVKGLDKTVKNSSNKYEQDITENNPKKQNPKKDLKKSSEMLNKNLPMRIDENRTLMNIDYDATKNELSFNYKLNGVSKSRLKEELPKFKKHSITTFKSSSFNKTAIKAEVTIIYLYLDENNSELGRYTISPNEYLNDLSENKKLLVKPKENFGQKESVTKAYDCLNSFYFDNGKICLPKINGWIECRNNKIAKKYVDDLEHKSTILGFYLPTEIYNNFQQIHNNSTTIELFAMKQTIGVKADNKILNIVYQGLKSGYQKSVFPNDKKKLIQSKTGYLIKKPISLDNYDSGKNIKTCVSLLSYENDNGHILPKICFTNIVNLNNRIYFLLFSIEIIKDFKYSLVKEQNEEILNEFAVSNKII